MTFLLILAVLALIALNALFVSAEYALVRSRVDRIEAMVERGERGAALFMRQIESIDEYIAACQVGITMASIGLGAVGEPTVARLLKHPLGGPLSHGAALVIAGILAYLIITSLLIVYGEPVPTAFTVVHADRVG